MSEQERERAAADPSVPMPEEGSETTVSSRSFPPPEVARPEGAFPELPAVPTEESPRQARKRAREERRRQRREERERARAERMEAKRLRAEEKRARREGASGSRAASEVPEPVPESEPALSPAAEAVGEAVAAPPDESEPQEGGEEDLNDISLAEAEERLLAAEGQEEKATIRAFSARTEAETERQIREIEQIERSAEGGVEEARIAAAEGTAGAPGFGEPTEEDEDPFADELRLADEQIDRRRRRNQELLEELEQTEMRIEAHRERTEEALARARDRLEEIEAQAGEAEERAARAERLAELREQEAERERRLREMLARINDAERRAREAERRAREAVAGSPPAGEPAEVAEASVGAAAEAAAPVEGGVLPGSRASIAAGEEGEHIAVELGDENAAQSPAAQLAPDEPAEFLPTASDPGAMAAKGPADLNTASFDELREAGLSVTQTGRVLAHRERSGGFSSVDELNDIPGFPRAFFEQVKQRLTVGGG